MSATKVFFTTVIVGATAMGCGSANSVAPATTDNIQTFNFSIGSASTKRSFGLKDITDNSIATSCEFILPENMPGSGIKTLTSGVEVVDDPDLCQNTNNCIICTTNTVGNSCSLNCTGHIIGTTQVLSDSFEIGVHFMSLVSGSDISTSHMLRVDTRSNWGIFDFTAFSEEGAPLGFNFRPQGCGGTGTFGIGDAPYFPTEETFDTIHSNRFALGVSISTVDYQSGETECALRMELTGHVPLSQVNFENIEINHVVTLCDLVSTDINGSDCPRPSGWEAY